MTKTRITILCIFCLIMAGILTIGGYATYEEYKAEHSNAEMGQDLLIETDNNITVITKTVTWFKNKLNFNVGQYFSELWNRLKNTFIDIFDWIPGVGSDNDDDDTDFGKDGSGFGVPETNGNGGGGGGARG